MPGAMRKTSGRAWAPERRMSSEEITKAAAATSLRLWLLRETEVTSVLTRSSRLSSSREFPDAWLLEPKAASMAIHKVARFIFFLPTGVDEYVVFIELVGLGVIFHDCFFKCKRNYYFSVKYVTLWAGDYLVPSV